MVEVSGVVNTFNSALLIVNKLFNLFTGYLTLALGRIHYVTLALDDLFG